MALPLPRRRAPRPSQRGFKVLEVLVAMAVLGITATGLMGLHVGAVKGIAESGSMVTAMDIASQRAEMYAVEGVNALTARNCPTVGAGCAANPPNPGAAAVNCMGQVGAANVDDGMGGPDGRSLGNRYRFDTVVRAFNAGGQAGAVMATVSVCWRENNGLVRRIQSQRLIAPRERS